MTVKERLHSLVEELGADAAVRAEVILSDLAGHATEPFDELPAFVGSGDGPPDLSDRADAYLARGFGE